MNIKQAREFIKDNYASLKQQYPNLQGILLSHKVINNSPTNEQCLTFIVDKKRPLSELSSHEIIPKNIQFQNSVIHTDVLSTLSLSSVPCIGTQNSTTTHPMSAHYAKHRPLKGGISCIAAGSSDATLGMLVVDKLDGSIVGLTNNHVACLNVLSVRRENMYYDNTLQYAIQQPASMVYNPFGEPNESLEKNYIGYCKRTYPFDNSNLDTTVDAAIIALTGYEGLISNESVNIVNFNQAGPYKWATTDEIDQLLEVGSPNYGAPLFRSGRTGGAFGYPGNDYLCSLSASGYGVLDVMFGIANPYIDIVGGVTPGPLPITLKEQTFSDVFIFESNNKEVLPAQGGDSGSVIFALLSANIQEQSTWKVVGLIFAGGTRGGWPIGVFCRIDQVAEKLNIAPWNGEVPVNYTPSRRVISVTEPEYDTNAKTQTLSGQTYYYAGSDFFDNNKVYPLMFSLYGNPNKFLIDNGLKNA